MNKELSEDYEKLRQRYEGARAELRNIHGMGERQKLRSLDSAITELDAFRRKYADLPELVDVLTAINKTLEDRQ
jgi:DNA repair exonuclease SbcCD ATPase subunit